MTRDEGLALYHPIRASVQCILSGGPATRQGRAIRQRHQMNPKRRTTLTVAWRRCFRLRTTHVRLVVKVDAMAQRMWSSARACSVRITGTDAHANDWAQVHGKIICSAVVHPSAIPQVLPVDACQF
jgi:hypothetical protein